MDRIMETFGSENYGQERLKLIHKACTELTDNELTWVVDHLIATVPTKYPPLVPRFTEAAHAARGNRLKRDIKSASNVILRKGDLKKSLEKFGAKNLVDAMNKVRGA